MPVILQEKLIQWILRPFARVMENVPERARSAAFSLSVLGIVLMEFARNSGLYSGRFLYQYVIAYVFLGVMILAGLTPELKPVRFSPVLTACWLGVTVFMMLTGLLVNTDALADAVLWAGVLPVLYLVWGGRRLDCLVLPVIRGVLLSFLVFSVVSIFFFPIDSVNYGSFFLNRNRTSLYLVAVFVCVYVYILSATKYSLRLLLADILLGFTVATIYYTNCRTGLLAAALCFLLTGLLQLCLRWKEWKRVLLCNLLPAAAAIVLLFPSAIHIYHEGYQLKTSIETALTASPIEPAPVKPPSNLLNSMKEYTEGRLDGTDKTLNVYTAGRVELWRIHLEKVGLLGNSADTVLYKANGEVETRSAHFTIIEYAYQFGAPAGIFFLALNLLAGLASIRYAVKRRNSKYALWPFAVAIIFGANSVMEAIGHPAQQTLDLLYFLSLAPLIVCHPSIPAPQGPSKKVLYIMHGDLDQLSSGSGVRPAAMYRAFLDRGWEVHLLSGYCSRAEEKQRRAEVRKAEAWMQENRPAFCYIESSADPIKHYCDYALIRLLHREGIPTAYFYRDAYRRFPNLFPRRGGFVNKLRETYLNFLQWRTDRVLRNVDVVYFPSEAFSVYFHYCRMKALPPAGELSGVSPGDAFPPEGPRTAIYVGGVANQYNTRLLLDSFSILNQGQDVYPLILVCREGEFENAFPGYEIPPWLELRHASGKELEPFYARAGLGLLATVQNEYTKMAVAVKLFQYASHGLPVLFTSDEAMEKLINENGFGRTAPHDAAAFAAAVKALLDDTEALREYRRQGLESLAERHLWVHRVDQIAADLLGNGGTISKS